MIYTVTLNPAIDRELQVAKLEPHRVMHAHSSQMSYGGKGINVSRGLAAIGAKSIALGFVGGSTGEMLTQEMANLDVLTDFVHISGEIRTNFSIVDKTRTQFIKVNEPGPKIHTQECHQLITKMRRLARPGDLWALCGSIPPGIPDSIYADIIQEIQSLGGKTLLDTSGPALTHGCNPNLFLVKPNASEASTLTGSKIDSTEDALNAASAILQTGVKHVIITQGRKGALLSNQAGTWIAVAPSITKRNDVGAGDAVMTGIMYGLSCDLSWPEILRWGVACGTAAASTEGTTIGSFTVAKQILSNVKIDTC
jgi:1-phosphofructokinase family hexose kinase